MVVQLKRCDACDSWHPTTMITWHLWGPWVECVPSSPLLVTIACSYHLSLDCLVQMLLLQGYHHIVGILQGRATRTDTHITSVATVKTLFPHSLTVCCQQEDYVEYSRHGTVIKGMERAKVKSRYEEDIYINNHTVSIQQLSSHQRHPLQIQGWHLHK